MLVSKPDFRTDRLFVCNAGILTAGGSHTCVLYGEPEFSDCSFGLVICHGSNLHGQLDVPQNDSILLALMGGPLPHMRRYLRPRGALLGRQSLRPERRPSRPLLRRIGRRVPHALHRQSLHRRTPGLQGQQLLPVQPVPDPRRPARRPCHCRRFPLRLRHQRCLPRMQRRPAPRPHPARPAERLGRRHQRGGGGSDGAPTTRASRARQRRRPNTRRRCRRAGTTRVPWASATRLWCAWAAPTEPTRVPARASPRPASRAASTRARPSTPALPPAAPCRSRATRSGSPCGGDGAVEVGWL
jgi:hypothetical protein